MMVSDPISDRRANPPQHRVGPCRSGRTIPAILVLIAVVLAIVFFYATREKRHDDRADALTKAAQSVDKAADKVGDAAQRLTRKFHDQD